MYFKNDGFIKERLFLTRKCAIVLLRFRFVIFFFFKKVLFSFFKEVLLNFFKEILLRFFKKILVRILFFIGFLINIRDFNTRHISFFRFLYFQLFKTTFKRFCKNKILILFRFAKLKLCLFLNERKVFNIILGFLKKSF